MRTPRAAGPQSAGETPVGGGRGNEPKRKCAFLPVVPRYNASGATGGWAATYGADELMRLHNTTGAPLLLQAAVDEVRRDDISVTSVW